MAAFVVFLVLDVVFFLAGMGFGIWLANSKRYQEAKARFDELKRRGDQHQSRVEREIEESKRRMS